MTAARGGERPAGPGAAGRDVDAAREPGDLAQLLRGPLSAEEHAAHVAAVRRQLHEEERALQAAVVRQIPAAARSLAVLNNAVGFRHPFVERVARFGWVVRPLVCLRDHGRVRRARRVRRGRAATLRRAPARSPGRGEPDPPPSRPLELEAAA